MEIAMPASTVTGRSMKRLAAAAVIFGSLAQAAPAEARSCSDLRALCWTMRTDKNDCTGPYRRCLQTGTFITPLGRVFKATSR
jgi:hypothetical protein